MRTNLRRAIVVAVVIAAPGGLFYLVGLEKPAYALWVIAGAFLVFAVFPLYPGGGVDGGGGDRGGD